jgi:hypothetical protein
MKGRFLPDLLDPCLKNSFFLEFPRDFLLDLLYLCLAYGVLRVCMMWKQGVLLYSVRNLFQGV